MELKCYEDEVDRIGEIFVQSVGKQKLMIQFSHILYNMPIPMTYCKGPSELSRIHWVGGGCRHHCAVYSLLTLTIPISPMLLFRTVEVDLFYFSS